MSIEEDMREKYFEMQYYEDQIKKLQKRYQELEGQLNEILAIESNIAEISKVKEGTEILVPIANGIFVKAKIEDPKEMRVNVGYGVNVRKSYKETINLMKKHGEEIKKARDNVILNINMFLEKSKKAEEEAIKLTKEYEKGN